MPRTGAAPSERICVKRMQERGTDDRASIDAMLDAQALARPAYNDSINYCAVTLLGSARQRRPAAGISDAVRDWVRGS